MKNKGFTLIELLAVIVILAIIALIATPIILGVIDKAKQGAAEQSANGYINAIENQVMISQLENGNLIEDGVYDLPMSNIEVKGNKPTSGWVEIEKGIVKDYSMKVNGYTVTKGKETKKDGQIENKPSTTEYTLYENGTAIYYNPVNGEKCEVSEAVSTTGTKTGCMKWYAFNDSKNTSTLNMILDHNTTAKIAWNNDNKNVSYEESNLKSEVDKLVSESKWKDTPRLISAEEIAKIMGNVTFNNSDENSWFYFDSNNQTQTAKAQGESKYAWLYDYTVNCVSYGCNVADSNTDGYWTSTIVETVENNIWRVVRDGALNTGNAVGNGNGIRPVVTISKSIIK